MIIAISIIVGSAIIARAIHKKDFTRPYTVSPTHNTTQAQIITKSNATDEFLKNNGNK